MINRLTLNTFSMPSKHIFRQFGRDERVYKFVGAFSNPDQVVTMLNEEALNGDKYYTKEDGTLLTATLSNGVYLAYDPRISEWIVQNPPEYPPFDSQPNPEDF